MAWKILVVLLAVITIGLMSSVRRQRRTAQAMMYFVYISFTAYKDISVAIAKCKDMQDGLEEMKKHFSGIRNNLREQLKEIGAPVDRWDEEIQD